MKKVLLLLVILLSFSSCNPDYDCDCFKKTYNFKSPKVFELEKIECTEESSEWISEDVLVVIKCY